MTDRGPGFFDWITDVFAFVVVAVVLLVVTHSLGWWGS